MCKAIVIALAVLYCSTAYGQQPRIVNIVNFVRLLEPRDPAITEDVLYQTVVQQIRLMREHRLKGTFLLQYDALIDPRYQKLLKALPRDSFEIGAWWEIPQPLVEQSGMQWRGRYPWDWRANIGFSTGYTPEERKKLIDTYMHRFKAVFGYYPRSVASWFIDAYSLNYMYEQYHIVASANCKDQYGTDGYTLWGGYWNQAYYPSKRNAYMPAQHKDQQIPVPIFRMLGSDPIRQYDNGLEQNRQGVVTLEPVYPSAGGDSEWVKWYFEQFVKGASMAFAYTQAGQENSFTWKAMKKGLKFQFALIEKRKDEGKIRVETLAESGQWFKQNFPLTPATAVTALEDVAGGDRKTVWFDSRFYRANLLWKEHSLRFRDIHLFDEQVASPYLDTPTASSACHFFTLPFVDGYLWSTEKMRAGLTFKIQKDGKTVAMRGDQPVVDDREEGVLHVHWSLRNRPGQLDITFTDTQLKISVEKAGAQDWFLDLEAADSAKTPFKEMSAHQVKAVFEGTAYTVSVSQGTVSKAAGALFRLRPENGKIILDFSE